jgi:hypothetical protein
MKGAVIVACGGLVCLGLILLCTVTGEYHYIEHVVPFNPGEGPWLPVL